MKCPYCKRKCERHTKQRARYTWGTDGVTKHGRHVFYLPDTFYTCKLCGEAWYDRELAKLHEQRLNEAIKKRLGFDWLAANAERRARFKSEAAIDKG